MTTDFFHAHTHSEHSMLDGSTRVSDIPLIAKEHGQGAIGLTDHGTLGAALKFWKAARELEIKGVFGVETYVTPDRFKKDKDSPTWHLVLLATNMIGLRNLFAMSKIAWTEGFYRKPRVDYEVLDRHSEGIIALTACMAGEISRGLELPTELGAPEFDRYVTVTDEAVEAMARYQNIYGDRLYAELQPGNPQNLNELIATMADDAGVKKVVTVDSHYDHCTSKSKEELLLVMQQLSGFKKADRDFAELMRGEASRETNLLDRLNKLWPNRGLRFDKHELYIMSRDEVVSRMDAQGFDGNELADATLEIAERCEQVEFKTGVNYLPKLDAQVDSDEWLEDLVFQGLKDRGLYKRQYIERAQEELEVIKDKGFSDYFLIVWDVYCEARRRDIYVGPGRGSAAGCLVAYALKITNIDPIRHKLLFFRFINPDRMDFPDIDMDFEHTRRDEMKTYMEDKHGERLSLCTYSEFKAKGLFASIAKSLGFKEGEVREITKHFDTVKEYEDSETPKLKSFRASNPEVGPLLRSLEGQVSGTGMHAAGVVVANLPMTNIVPVESRTDPDDKKLRVTVSAFDMSDAEEVGLIKFDFLGLSNLTIIHDAVRLVEKRHGIKIDWENLGPEADPESGDEDVYSMLDGQNTVGVFQMESSQYRNLISDQGIADFNDLAASNALVRPGAYETVAKDYIKRKHGREKTSYPHPVMEEWLEETYGLVVYQEQLMMAAVLIGGFTQGEAEKLRKIIGKKRDVTEFAQYYDKWITNAGEMIGEKKAEKMWHDFEKHAGYSFNKSHAVAYSYISYVTAWFKYHYPIEYIYASLKNEKSAMTTMTYLLEARRLGIEILPPDVNYSELAMMVDEDALRFGLTDIKSVGEASAKHMILKRPFNSWDEWGEKIVAKNCNKKVVDALFAVDGFASIPDGPHNSDAKSNYMEFLNYPLDLEHVQELGITYEPIDTYVEGSKEFMVVCGVTKSIKRTATYVRLELEDITGKMTCFGQMSNDLSEGEVVLALVGDKSMMGYARVDGFKERIVNGHLDNFEKLLLGRAFEDVKHLYSLGIGKLDDAKALVLPLSVRPITTKNGKRMAFSYITDGEQVVKLTIFPQVWEKLEGKITEFKPICVKLRRLDDGGHTVNADGVVDAQWLYEQNKDKVNG